MLELFDDWAFSDEVGWFKPSPEIFHAAFGGLGVDDPARVLHIGDLRRTDVAGAAAVGMRTARYRRVHDDADPGPEAELIVDDHRDLPRLL